MLQLKYDETVFRNLLVFFLNLLFLISVMEKFKYLVIITFVLTILNNLIK